MESKILLNLIINFYSTIDKFSDFLFHRGIDGEKINRHSLFLVLHHCHTAALLYITHFSGKISAILNSPQNILFLLSLFINEFKFDHARVILCV